MNHLLYKHWVLLTANSPNKNSLSLMRSNLIGHTVFLTSEKYRMTNQKPDTIFFTSEKIRIGFSRLSGRSCEVIESECLQRSLLYQNHGFKAWTFIEDQENENTRKKTRQNVALLKEFLTLRKTYRRNSPEGAECIHRWIYHYGSKERQQRRLWT